MRKFLTAVLAALLMAVFGAALTASATEEPVVVSNEVVSSPDNHCPTWARDTFTRTLTITPLGEDADADYHVRSDISGTWTETAEVPAVGSLSGYVEYTVTGELGDLSFDGETVDLSGYDCKSDVPKEHSASQWAKHYFTEDAETNGITDWEYVYTQDCSGDVFVENDKSGSVGAKTFKPCKVHPVEPTVTAPTCEAPGELVIPEVEGVAYYADVLSELEWNVGATPREGYRFRGDQLREWSLTAEPALDCVTPLEPTAIDRTCEAPGFIEIPDVDGVTYAVDGDPYEHGTFAFPPGTYTVTAELDEGRTLDPEDADTSWTVTVNPELEACVGGPGEDGEDGKDGKDGEDGKDGRDGEDGKDGRDGKDGKDGKDGENATEKPDSDPEGNDKDGGDKLPDTGFSPLLALLGTGLTAGGAGLMRLRRMTL